MKFTAPPGYVRTKPPAKPKLDPFIPVIDRILFDDKPSLEVFSSASLMHLCSGKRCYFTPALTFGLTRDQERREVFNLLEIMRVRIEVPDAQELIRNQDRVDRPALVVVDGVGIGRAIVQELSREMRHLLPGGSFDDQNISGLKARRFHNAMPPMYDGLVRLPTTMLGLETLLAEFAAFPDGRNDD